MRETTTNDPASAPRVAPGGEPDHLSALRSLANGHASGHYGGGVQAAAVCEDARDALITLRARAEQALATMREALAIADEWFGGCDCITTETGTDERKTRYWALRATVEHPERPDETPETPRPASTADLDQRDRALER